MVCWLCLVGSAVALLVIYKLVDTLLRRPRVSQLTDRYILVTGCDTGFGHGIAKRLDALGCHVFAGCLTQKGQNELRESCSDRVVTLLLDISDPDSVRKAFDFVKNQLPADQGLWGLLNNAGILGRIGPPEWLRVQDYREVLDVNLLGLIDVTMTFLPLVKQSRGRIVNMSSMVGRHANAYSAPYSVSKYGIEAFTDSLRRTLDIYGCEAVLIEPGLYRTDISSPSHVSNMYQLAWNDLPPQTKSDYGDEYIVEVLKYVSYIEKATSPRISEVLDAYEHALLGVYPRARYVVGKDACYFWLPLQALPEWIVDGFLAYLQKDRPMPAVIKKRQ